MVASKLALLPGGNSVFLRGTEPGADAAASPHGARRCPRCSPGWPRSVRGTAGLRAEPGRAGPAAPRPQPNMEAPEEAAPGRGTAPPPPAPPRRRGAARATRGTAAEPRDPRSPSLPLALSAERPTEAERAGGSRARLASSFTPGGAGTAGRRQRRAGSRYGHSPRPGSRREPRPPPSFGRCPGKQRARAKECGRSGGGREQSVPGTARRSPPRAPPRPGAAAAALTCSSRRRSSCRCCSSCAAPPRSCRARRWLSLPGLPAAPSPPLSRGGGRVWERPSPQREPCSGPRPRLRSAPHLGSVPCRGREEGLRPRSAGVRGLAGAGPLVTRTRGSTAV